MLAELSIVIPTLNEEKYLPRLLTSLTKQDYAGKLQVIIVDGNSTDNTFAVAKAFTTRIYDLEVLKTRPDVGHQRNKGATAAKYKNLLFLDADMVLPRHFLQHFLSKIGPHENLLASVMIWPADGNILHYGILVLIYPIILLMYILNPTTPGGLTFIRTAMHRKIKGYQEDTLCGEDIEYGYRAVKNGAKPHIFLTPFAYHSIRRTRLMGIGKMFLSWLKMWWHVRKYGVISKKSNISYPFGRYNSVHTTPK